MSGICQHMVNWLNTSLYIKSCHVKWMQFISYYIVIVFCSIQYHMIQYFQTQHCLFYNHLGSTWDPSCAAAGPLLCRWVLWPGRLTKDLGKSFVTSNMSFLHPFGLHVGLHVGLPPGLPKWLTDIQQTNRLVQGITHGLQNDTKWFSQGCQVMPNVCICKYMYIDI